METRKKKKLPLERNICMRCACVRVYTYMCFFNLVNLLQSTPRLLLSVGFTSE